MIKLELKSKDKTIEATIPERWEEVTIEQAVSLFKKNNELNDLDLLSLLSRIELSILNQCKTKDVLWLIVNLRKIFTKENLDKESAEAATSFEFENETYYLAKDLGAETIGELYDLIKVQEWIDGGQHEHLSLMLAMLYRPKEEAYDFSKCQDRAKRFDRLPITTVWKARNFFFLLTNLSERISSTSEFLQNKATA